MYTCIATCVPTFSELLLGGEVAIHVYIMLLHTPSAVCIHVLLLLWLLFQSCYWDIYFSELLGPIYFSELLLGPIYMYIATP